MPDQPQPWFYKGTAWLSFVPQLHIGNPPTQCSRSSSNTNQKKTSEFSLVFKYKSKEILRVLTRLQTQIKRKLGFKLWRTVIITTSTVVIIFFTILLPFFVHLINVCLSHESRKAESGILLTCVFHTSRGKLKVASYQRVSFTRVEDS